MVQQSERSLKNSSFNNTPDMSAHHVERYNFNDDDRLPSREFLAEFGSVKVVKLLLQEEPLNSPPLLPLLLKSP